MGRKKKGDASVNPEESDAGTESLGTSLDGDDLSTVPAGAHGDEGPVVVELLPGTFGGLGGGPRAETAGEEGKQVSLREMNQQLDKAGAGEVAALSAAGGSVALNIDLRGEYTAPHRKLALTYRDQHHPRGEDGESLSFYSTPTGRFRGPCSKSENNADLIRFGAGISTYFKLLKLLFWMYLTMLFIQLPVITFNVVAGDYFAEASFPLAQTTIGNLYREAFDNQTDVIEVYFVDISICRQDGEVVCEIDVDSMVFYYGLMDAVTTLVFLLFVSCAQRFVRLERKRFRTKVLKVEHYSVQVTGVPANCTVELLETHFEELVKGSVHDVQLVQASGNAISLCVERGKLIKQLARSDARRKYLDKHGASLNARNKAQERYEKVYAKVEALDVEASKSAEQGDALFAFVTFEHQRDRAKCLQLYHAFTCSWSQQPLLRLQGESVLKVEEAPPPSTLLWENNEVTSLSRFVRQSVTTSMLVLLLFITVGINYLTEPYKISKSVADAVTGTGAFDGICGGAFASTTTFEEATALADSVVTLDVGGESLDLKDCLCENALASALVFPNGTEPEVLFSGDAYCADFLANRSKDLSIQIAVSFATLLLNSVIFLFLTQSGFFLKYTSVVQREMTIMRRLFVTTYVNTALLVLVVNADVEGIFETQFGGLAASLFGQGTFVDYTAGWFQVVAVEIMLFGLLNVFAPHFYPILLLCINTARRLLRKPISQSELNELYLGPDFILSFRLSQVLMSAFFIMTYSSGIPVMYLFGVLGIPLSYWVDKLFFTKICRTPIEFPVTLGLWATKTLQWAAVVHLGMGVWMLSSPFIFPNSVSDLSAGALETIGGALGKEADEFSNSTFVETDVEFLADVQSRFLKNSSLPNLLLLVAFFTYKILHQFKFFTAALAFVASYLDRFLAYFMRGGNILSSLLSEEYDDDRQLSFDQALSSSSMTGVTSYFILDNPRYARAFHRPQQESGETASLLSVLRQRATDSSGALSNAFSVSGDSF